MSPVEVRPVEVNRLTDTLFHGIMQGASYQDFQMHAREGLAWLIETEMIGDLWEEHL